MAFSYLLNYSVNYIHITLLGNSRILTVKINKITVFFTETLTVLSAVVNCY